MKTAIPSGQNIPRSWHIIDAENVVLGRLASKAANILMGKHKPSYTPYIDMGDHIIVVNAEKVKLTGNKREQKTYRHHTGWTGHVKSTTADKMLAGPHAERVLEGAVRGMLPKNSLGRQMFRKLKVYKGPEHPHAAQKPEVLELA